MGAGGPLVCAVEVGHDVAGEQLIVVAHALGRGELVSHEEDAAEAAVTRFPHTLQPLRHLFGRAEEGAAVVDAPVGVVLGAAVVRGRGAPQGAAEVLEIELVEADGDVAAGLLAAFGHVDARHHAVVAAVERVSVLGGRVRCGFPDALETGTEGLERRAGEDTDAVLSGHAGAARGGGGRDEDGDALLVVGRELAGGVLEGEPAGALVGDLLAGEEAEDDAEALIEAGTELGGVEAKLGRIGGGGAGAHAEHHASTGELVEEEDALGDHVGVVVAEGEDAGAELDGLGLLGDVGDEDLGAGDGLPAAGVVLADEDLVVAKFVEPLDGADIAADGEGHVVAHGVVGGHEEAELEPPGKLHACLHRWGRIREQ